jgi:amino acid transporter
MSNENKKPEKKVYRDGLGEIKNPAQTLFGKILIWILAISMVIAIFAALIFSIIEQF